MNGAKRAMWRSLRLSTIPYKIYYRSNPQAIILSVKGKALLLECTPGWLPKVRTAIRAFRAKTGYVAKNLVAKPCNSRW